MRDFARGFIAVVLLFAIIILAITAPIGQLTFLPLIVLTAMLILLVTVGMGESHLGVIEVRTINAAPEDYPEWSWPTEKDHPWLSEFT